MERKAEKIFCCAALLAITALAGCSAENGYSAEVNGSVLELDGAGFSAEIPEGWNVYTGGAVYDEIYRTDTEGFDSAEEMQESMRTAGLDYIAYMTAPDETSMMTVSVQDMTAEEGMEDYTPLTAEEYARSVHDTTVFTYQANGYKIDSGSFGGENIGGISGLMSHFDIYEDDGTLFLGQYEFMFEDKDSMIMIQICYSDTESADSSRALLDGIKSTREG